MDFWAYCMFCCTTTWMSNWKVLSCNMYIRSALKIKRICLLNKVLLFSQQSELKWLCENFCHIFFLLCITLKSPVTNCCIITAVAASLPLSERCWIFIEIMLSIHYCCKDWRLLFSFQLKLMKYCYVFVIFPIFSDVLDFFSVCYISLYEWCTL